MPQPLRRLAFLILVLAGLVYSTAALAQGMESNSMGDPLSVTIVPGGFSQPPPFEGTLGVKVKHGVGPFTYEWDLGSDGTVDGTDPTFKVSASEVGTQRVEVRVTDAEGKASGHSVPILAMNPIQVQESLGYRAAIVLLLGTCLLFFAYFLTDNNPILAKASKWAYIAGFVALTYSLVFRSIDSNRLPNIHLYEVLQLFSFFALGWCLWASLRFKDARPMAYCAMLVGLVLLYISNFSGDMKDPGVVQPALQSYWRNIHVTAIILSYGGITAAYFASIAYLMKPGKLADHIAYKATMFAYPLLTAGIIMGGLWANEAWGTYWSWDPKETASLVIWLVLTAYLHTRMILGWGGVPSALFSIAGFAAMVFCFVGLNFMPGNSLHKYSGDGLSVGGWILLSSMLVFHGYIWVSQRPWAIKREAELLAAAEDISEAGVDPVGRKPLPGLT